jgi:type IV pilus assembly protein PilX
VRPNYRCKSRTGGSVLAVTLLILLTMTLLALAASHVTKTQTRVATASQEQDQAFQNAEAALRAGEQLVLSSTDFPPCSDAPCRIYPDGVLDASDIANANLDWWTRHAFQPSHGDQAQRVLEGHFIIEKLQETPDSLAIDPHGQSASTHYYRISAVGLSNSGQPRVVLQSVVAQRVRS